MGTGGSVEMKIPVSDDLDVIKNGKRFITKHSSQPQNSLPASKTKPRGMRASQSLYSVDMAGSPSNQTSDSARRENELKITKEQDAQALIRKEQKLEDENNRLRAELQALSRLNSKLRAERFTAIESCNDANQRAIALDQDREKIQRQFKIFRETKESEIQGLLQEKRELESKLHRLQAHGVATGNEIEFKSTVGVTKSSSLIPTSPTPPNQWWDRPESDTTSLFGSFTQIRNAAAPESNASIAELKGFDDPQGMNNNDWHISNSNYFENSGMLLDYSDPEYASNCQLRCLITGTKDSAEIIENLLKSNELNQLKNLCLTEGYFLSVMSLIEPFDDGYPLKDIMAHAISVSNVVMCFVGSEDSDLLDVSYKLLHPENRGEKTTMIYLFESKKSDASAGSLCSVLRTDVARNKGKSLNYASVSEAVGMSMDELRRLTKVELGVDVEKSFIHDDGVNCVEDIALDDRIEQEQRELCSVSSCFIKPVGFERYYDRLDEFASVQSPTPPLLISAKQGLGRTTLLKSWLDRLQKKRENFLIFHHFVTTSRSPTADPILMMRRLLHQISRHLPPYLLPPPFVLFTYDPARLRLYLSEWLDRLSSMNSKQIVVVIDSIDVIQDFEKHFKWLLDPLPVSVRVVVSVGESCPQAWNQWPTVHVEPLPRQHVYSVLSDLVGSETKLYRQFRDEIMARYESKGAHPLDVALLSKVLCGDFINDQKSLIRECLEAKSCSEIYNILLDYIEEESKKMECQNDLQFIIQFVFCSRSGLNENEILPILPELPLSRWLRLRFLLMYFDIFVERAATFQISNSIVASIVEERFIDNRISKSRSHMLIKLFTKVISPKFPRTAEFLPWLFYKLGRRSDLQNCLLHPYIFHHLYTSGRASEIIHYWQFITEDKEAIIDYYKELMIRLRDPEALIKKNNLFIVKSDAKMDSLFISNIYESVGRFFRDLNVMDVAVTCLERSMEIRENELDPDHHLVADCLHYLGTVYIRWKKYAMAEPLLKHALELIECVAGQEHPRVIQELQSLCFVTRKLDRHEEANTITRRISSLQDRYGILLLSTSRFARLRKHEAKLEQLALEEGTTNVANVMNDLGVLCLAQKKLKSALSFFEKSLTLKRKLLGENHADVAQSFQNLSAVFSEEKQYQKATENMRKALNVRKNVFGEHSPIVLSTAKNLAILCKKSKDFDQARQVYQEMLILSKEIHGEDSVVAATAMMNLAVFESQLGKSEAALPLYEQANDVFKSQLGESCKEVAETYRNIAILRYNDKQFEEAAVLYKKSMAIHEQLKQKAKTFQF